MGVQLIFYFILSATLRAASGTSIFASLFCPRLICFRSPLSGNSTTNLKQRSPLVTPSMFHSPTSSRSTSTGQSLRPPHCSILMLNQSFPGPFSIEHEPADDIRKDPETSPSVLRAISALQRRVGNLHQSLSSNNVTTLESFLASYHFRNGNELMLILNGKHSVFQSVDQEIIIQIHRSYALFLSDIYNRNNAYNTTGIHRFFEINEFKSQHHIDVICRFVVRPI